MPSTALGALAPAWGKRKITMHIHPVVETADREASEVQAEVQAAIASGLPKSQGGDL